MSSADLIGSVRDAALGLVASASSSLLWFGPLHAGMLGAALVLYFAIPRRTWQNLVLLALGANLVWHVSRFYFLVLFLSAGAEWWIARSMHRETSQGRRRALFWTSAAMNFTIMCSFLFPLEPIVRRATAFLGDGTPLERGLGWLFASFVASAFFLFSKMTLTIDAYHGRLKEEPPFLDSIVFASLFTRSWGTPMDRARDTLPQLASARRLDPVRLEEGTWQVLLGIFKFSLSMGFGSAPSLLVSMHSTSWLGFFLGSWAMALRFWLTFSATIDVSRGLGAVFGLELPKNFDLPYFATNIADFWRRWNMSFGNWLYEEVFAKLNFQFRNWGNLGLALACLGTFGISALAHGMDWGAILWIGVQGAMVYAYFVLRPKIKRWNKKRNNPRWFAFAGWFVTMHSFVALLTLTAYDTIAEISAATLSLLGAPLWREIPAVTPWKLGGLCVLVLVFHSLPRWVSYESFRSRVPTAARLLLIPASVGGIVGIAWLA